MINKLYRLPGFCTLDMISAKEMFYYSNHQALLFLVIILTKFQGE